MPDTLTELPVAPLEQLRRRRSAKWRTWPDDVLPLPVAEMDFDLAPPIAEVLRAAIDRSDVGYAMPAAELGRALAGFARRRWDWVVDPEAVTGVADVGVGAVELIRALTARDRVRTARGRRVAVSPPVYPPFFDWVAETGAERVEVPLVHGPAGWRLDLEGLEEAFAGGVAAYVLCNPHNPVGRVHTAGELATLVDLASRHGVTIVSDEIHAPLTLAGATFTPLLSLPGAAEVAVTLASASKAWNLAGLKCAAAVTASAEMDEVVRRFPADTRWRMGHLGVLGTVAALSEAEGWLDRLLLTLDRRRAQLASLLAEHLPDVGWHPPEGTFLAWLDCRYLGPGDTARQRYLDEARVALEPGPRFGSPGDGYVRLNLATSAEILDEAVRRMATVRPG